MAASNDQLPSPLTKPRMSPLDFRNTELVSRLLAATPPYLYNMSLLPNSYFFSEMLRSLVQAKNEVASRGLISQSNHQRRSRKRPWGYTRNENYPKPQSPKVEKFDSVDIPGKFTGQEQKLSDTPLELTNKEEARCLSENKMPSKMGNYPNPVDNQLILPPAPPVWFPPIYPSPYVDPLHFFIDLRVSGHIYDRNQKEEKSETATSTGESNADKRRDEISFTPYASREFKQSKHASAFSVPMKNSPMNLSQLDKDTKTKFDVKSLGFEKCSNKTSTGYIMGNIANIYKEIRDDSILSSDNSCNLSEENEEEKEKSEDGPKPFISLELVADYMHNKKEVRGDSPSESPPLEVVAMNDEVEFDRNTLSLNQT